MKQGSVETSADARITTQEVDALPQEIVLTLMRVGTCSLMIHHGLDKIQNVDGFSHNVVEKFFYFLPGPSEFWTLSAAGTQIIGSLLLGIGLFSRLASLSMLATMLVAVVFHLKNTGFEGYPLQVVNAHSYNYELAVMYVLILSYFAVQGSGKYSIDQQVIDGDVLLYQTITNSSLLSSKR